jgi:hypothetical protein
MEAAVRDYGKALSWKDVVAWEAHAQIYRFFGRHMPRELYELSPHLVRSLVNGATLTVSPVLNSNDCTHQAIVPPDQSD